MGMVVRTNNMAVNAHRNLGINNANLGSHLEKLASGFRINRAADDASGLAISEKMKAQIKGLETASANAQDGISLIQTAEGALAEVHDMLNRMVELAGKSANGTMDDNVDRAALQKEVESLQHEINRIAQGTNFNGIKLLDGSMGVASKFTPGAAGTASATGTETVYTLDFSKVDIIEGGKVTVGGTEFEFVTEAVAGDDTKVVIGANRDATLSALQTAITTENAHQNFFGPGNDATVTAADGKLTFTSEEPGISEPAYEMTATVTTSGMGLTLQIGDTADAFNKVTVSVGDMSTVGLGINSLSVATQSQAADAMALLKNNDDPTNGYGAINVVSTVRANLGALQNRLEHTISNLDVAAENMTAANSRIRDTDMAKQMMEYTKANVLGQAAQAMLAQANQQPQAVLQLLQ